IVKARLRRCILSEIFSRINCSVQHRVEGEPTNVEAPRGPGDKAVEAEPPKAFTRQHRWILAPPEELNGSAISWSEICGSECIARLLLRKGFRCAEEVDAFLRPRLGSLGDPFLLPQMRAAVSRILDALQRRERIVLFGDYDVDGVTSLALLAEMLRAYGSAPELFLPLRMEEGYGLGPESIERCLGQYRP